MNWISDFVDFTGLDKVDLIHRFSLSTAEVENEIFFKGSDISGIVVAEIKSVENHPDSKKLHLLKVDAGDGELTDVVCGAPNVRVGLKTAFAKVGAKIGDIEIAPRKLAGFISNGMCCSESEIGISDDNSGIMEITDDLPNGTDIKEAYQVDDIIFEVDNKSLTNRPDLWGHYGIAREFAALAGRELKPLETVDLTQYNNLPKVDMKIEDPLCQRYSCLQVENINTSVSPVNMRIRLFYCGMRAINFLADLTNYLMLEMGQPMHAFDLRDLQDNKIIVRRANDGEVIKTLDEQDRTLTSNDLVIADGGRAVAIAGVMGGFNSEVKDDTTTVIFESATFDGASVRLTAQRVGLRTESSSRYEKGLDYNNTVPAVERACQLVEELGCGENVGGMIDVMGNVTDMQPLAFRPDKINAFLGTDIPTEDMVKYFDALEIKVDLDKMTVTPPSFRPDLEGEADIAEEVARFYGYDKIPVTLLSGEATCGMKTERQQVQDRVNELLTAQGMYEIYTYTFTSPSIFDKLNIPKDSEMRNVVKITNPLGTSVMRTTTIASMMDILSRNYNYRNPSAKLFEIGKIFIPTTDGELPNEPVKITMGMYGDNVDFYDIKGICETMFAQLNVKNVKYEAVTDNPTFHPGRCAKISAGNKVIGIIGEIHPAVSRKYGIETPVYIAELDFENVFLNIKTDIKFKELPKYPAVTRDIAMLVDKTVPVADIENVIKKASGKMLESLQLFDVYEGKQIPEGKKSVAYSAIYRSADRSLTGDEVQKVFDKVVKNLENQIGAQLR